MVRFPSAINVIRLFWEKFTFVSSLKIYKELLVTSFTASTIRTGCEEKMIGFSYEADGKAKLVVWIWVDMGAAL